MNKYQKAFSKVKNHQILNDDEFWGGPYKKLYDELPKELDTIKELVDNATPKELTIYKYGSNGFRYRCPKCRTTILLIHNYCSKCGQALECVKYEKNNL